MYFPISDCCFWAVISPKPLENCLLRRQIETAAVAGAGTIGSNLDNPANFGFAIHNTMQRDDQL